MFLLFSVVIAFILGVIIGGAEGSRITAKIEEEINKTGVFISRDAEALAERIKKLL
jgi:hypothetical protein